MKNNKINRLLKKKSWTGEDVGQLLLASLLHDIKLNHQPDDINYTPLFSQTTFTKIEQSLKTDSDWITYDIYKNIYYGLLNSFNTAQLYYHQFGYGYLRYYTYLKGMLDNEVLLHNAEFIPFVLTEKQYASLCSGYSEKAKAHQENFIGVFFNVLSHIMEHPEEAPDNIRRAIEATKEECIKNQRIFEYYRNCAKKMGYYTLSDGTRSDKIPSEEWVEKLEKNYTEKHPLLTNGDIVGVLDNKKQFEVFKLYFQGVEAIKDLYEECTGEKVLKEQEADFSRILDDLTYNARQGHILTGLEADGQYYLKIANTILNGISDEIEWHQYFKDESFLETLTLYEVLKNNLDIYKGETNKDKKARLKEFKTDYPALYKALVRYIKDNIPKAKELKTTQYTNDFITWGELADLNIGGYASYCAIDSTDKLIDAIGTDTTEDLLKRRRITLNGVNIAKNPFIQSLTQEGEYKDKLFSVLAFKSSPFDIPDKAKINALKEQLANVKNYIFLPALQSIYTFNALTQILGKVYKIDDIKEALLDTDTLEQHIQALNDTLYFLYASVYGTDTDRQQKRKIIKYMFQPIDIEPLKPTNQSIEALTTKLLNLGFSIKAKEELDAFNDLFQFLSNERG